MKRRAFTLIELLVAVSIISLLIGILLPALSRSRQLGRSTACLSNLHALGQAVLMYADNQDGRLPDVGLAHGGSVNESAAWINAMKCELGNNDVARCPNDRSRHWLEPPAGTTELRRLSYASNYYLTGKVPGKEAYNVYTKVARPATTIFWAELTENGEYAVADHVHPETWFTNPTLLAGRQIEMTRHIGRANYGFVDGHAEPQRFEDTYSINLAATVFPRIAWDHNKYDPTLAW